MKTLEELLRGRIFVEERRALRTWIDPHSPNGQQIVDAAKREIFRIRGGVEPQVALREHNQWVSVSPSLFARIQEETLKSVNRLVEAVIADKLRTAFGWRRSGEERIFFEVNSGQRMDLLSECERYGTTFRSLDEIFFWLEQAGFASEGTALIMAAWTRPIQAKAKQQS